MFYVFFLVLCSVREYRTFFFQAEDCIRYLVRSRGLGDVYKRQHWRRMLEVVTATQQRLRHDIGFLALSAAAEERERLSLIHI